MKFAALIQYAQEPERIAQWRSAHRAYLADLLHQGRLALAGPFADGSGALFVYDAPNEQEAANLAANDPFSKAELFQQIVMKPWTPLFANADTLTPAM